MKRGEEFVGAGDFASARQVYQRAAEVGDARAALLLAATYDPNELGRFRTKGLAADIAKARFWYEKARALGSAEAPRRLDLLAQPRR
jgi:TPR repeat protein